MQTIALMNEADGPGGAEIFLLNLAEELRRRGRRVVPVLPREGSGWLQQQFLDRGFPPRTFRLEGFLGWKCLRDIVTALSDEQVDVVHSQEFTMGVFGTAATRILRKRHVITMHANQDMTKALRRRLALQLAFRASAATVAVSEDFRQHLLGTMRLRPDLVTVIPNGIPDPGGNPAGPRQEFSLDAEEVVLLAAGNLSERKGHIVLVRALDLLRREGCTVRWRLIIAGDGPERPRLEAFVAESGLDALVHLPGYRSDVADLQAAADVLVMPSLWEGLPLAILEGMHSGNAIVGSHISGIPEAVRQGQDGLLVPPGDVPALANALRALLEDPGRRRKMGASARERARADFSMERMTDRYEALYGGADAEPDAARGSHPSS